VQVQSRPQAAVSYFNQLVADKLLLDKALLKYLDMPKPIALSEDIWAAANKDV